MPLNPSHLSLLILFFLYVLLLLLFIYFFYLLEKYLLDYFWSPLLPQCKFHEYQSRVSYTPIA